MLKLKCGDGLLFGFLILGSVGCTDRCFLSKSDKAPDSKSLAKKEATPRPPTWPPENPAAVASRDSYSKPVGAPGSTVSKPNEPIGIQPIGQYEKSGGDSGVIQAQRLETVPYTKGAAASPGGSSSSSSSSLMPSANPDLQKLPVFPENGASNGAGNGAGAANRDGYSPPPFSPSNSLSIPPPPPGSPLGGITPLGIPTPPSSNPNR